jgi:hypothetical protein
MEENKRIGDTSFSRDSFRRHAVKGCKNIREFLEKYYRMETRYKDCSEEEYLERLVKQYQGIMDRNGFILLISNYSKTGKMISFYKD